MFHGKEPEGRKLRYYIYISDSKLDMLFEQIDRSILKRISAEVKVDIKIASITLREADQPGATRIAKLRVVERFLEKNHTIGTIQKPGREYFRGTMDMEWGWTGGDDSGVWFEGNDFNEGQYIGLGGTAPASLMFVPERWAELSRVSGCARLGRVPGLTGGHGSAGSEVPTNPIDGESRARVAIFPD